MLSSKEDEGEKLGEKSERERERERSGGRSQDRVGSSLSPSPFEFVKQERGNAFNSCSNYFHDPRN